MANKQSAISKALTSTESGFLTVLALSLGLAVALGLARFAYALLLPAMRSDLDWSYTLAGGMNTGNAAGYLIGALLAAPAMARFEIRRCFVVFLLITALVLLGSGMPSGYTSLLALRVVAGVSGAVVFIAGSALAAHVASRESGRWSAAAILGVYYGGGGFGILISGLGVPTLLEFGPDAAWRWAWAGLGLASLLAFAVAARAASRQSCWAGC